MQRRKQSVELGRLELPTSCLQNKRSSRLNYNPKIMNDEFIKEYMLSSYILVLSTKRLRRDLNPCYSCVTGKCHNQLGDGAKTRWICLQFNIPNITHYLYCCIHLNGGGRTRTCGVSLWLIYSQLPSPLDYSPASLLSRTAIL